MVGKFFFVLAPWIIFELPLLLPPDLLLGDRFPGALIGGG